MPARVAQKTGQKRAYRRLASAGNWPKGDAAKRSVIASAGLLGTEKSVLAQPVVAELWPEGHTANRKATHGVARLAKLAALAAGPHIRSGKWPATGPSTSQAEKLDTNLGQARA